MRPESGAYSKFYLKDNQASENRSVIRRKSGIKISVARSQQNNVQIHAPKKDPHKKGGDWRSFFTPIQVSGAG